MSRWLSLLVLACVLLAGDGCVGGGGPDHEGSAGDAERPTKAVTVYQAGLELFMEFPSFVVGESSPLIAHFTDARNPEGFRAVVRGSVTAVLRFREGAEERFAVDAPLRDGVFKPIVVPTTPGEAMLTLVLEGDQMTGTVEVGTVTVHPTVAAAVAATPGEGDGEPSVIFLKEQQWKTVYATAAATARVLRGGIPANGELKPVAGRAADIAAPVSGRVEVGDRVPHLGQRVEKGEILLTILPTIGVVASDLPDAELELQRARAELGLSERELARMQNLIAAKAVPEKRLDAARVARDTAGARLTAAERHLAYYRGIQAGGAGEAGTSAFEMRAPIDGVVSFADLTRGAVVDAGTRLVSLVDTERLWLEVYVYEPDAARVEASPGATFTVAGLSREFTVDETNGRRVAVGAVVDAATRTVPVIFELPNPDGVLRPGMFTKVTLLTGETVRDVAIPESAVVDDSGRPAVFVMDGGESFFQRQVRLGVRSGGFVQVLEGVREGDRVVTRGAYEIKLSTATGAIPEHGHQH